MALGRLLGRTRRAETADGHSGDTSRKGRYDFETAKATLETARADAEEETDRMKVLDGKLSNVAAFSGLSLSISGAVGANVLASEIVVVPVAH